MIPALPILRIVLITLLLILIIYSWLLLFNLPTPILIATGISMRPTIIAGDLLILDKPDFSIIKEGDIIAYKGNNNGNIIAHRVVEVRDDYVITKGDNNQANDPPVRREDYIGRVVYIIPRVGVPFILITSNPVLLFILLISIALVLLALYYERKEGS